MASTSSDKLINKIFINNGDKYLNIKNFIKEIDYPINMILFDKLWKSITDFYDVLFDDDFLKYFKFMSYLELINFMNNNDIKYNEYEYLELDNICIIPENDKDNYIVLAIEEFEKLMTKTSHLDEFTNIKRLYDDHKKYQLMYIQLYKKSTNDKINILKSKIIMNIKDLIKSIENSIKAKNEALKTKNILMTDKENITKLLNDNHEYELLEMINTELEIRKKLIKEVNTVIDNKYDILKKSYQQLEQVNSMKKIEI